jgi:hypothetical protein
MYFFYIFFFSLKVRDPDEPRAQSNELTRGPPELVQHFLLSAKERCMS